ncbi:GntR family transcriptional regulator [Leifsonia poae]|uniref:GntR family transcriptional regulator n=1 Tax=Leifsonia poae TaxID=110933 RepID=UPI001CBDC51A|nr:GntR family transcriptional regulator [Leifsonia poae]
MPVPDTEAVNPRRLIRDEVFLRLLDAIVDGDLLPGEQLFDAEIEKWVGVSRTPVREALNQLAAMGLVEILPQKRTRVTPIDTNRLRGLIETLRTLFRSVVRDATPLLTDGDKAELASFAEQISSGEGLADLGRSRLVSENFLNIYVRRLDNKTIARLLSRHMPEIRRAINIAPSTAPFETGLPILQATVDASIAGDADTAAAGVDDFWLHTVGALVDSLETEEK